MSEHGNILGSQTKFYCILIFSDPVHWVPNVLEGENCAARPGLEHMAIGQLSCFPNIILAEYSKLDNS